MVRRTQEDIITQCRKVHNDFYTYSDFVFTRVVDKSIVTCPLHGNFEIQVNSHQNGSGCQTCYNERRHLVKVLTQEEFEEKVRKKHGTRYNLSKAVYVDQYAKVVIGCQEHGDFEIQPSNLMQGRGCQKCGRYTGREYTRLTLDEWKQRCSDVHDNYYSYHACTEYKNQKTRMLIHCPLHGYFDQAAVGHIEGKGCTGCSLHGYDSHSPSYLYILTNKDFTKIGITNRKTSIRCKTINYKSDKDFQVFHDFYFEKGSDAFDMEQSLLKELRPKYEQPKEKFDGSTECFYDLDPKYLKFLIEQKIQELKSEENSLETA